MLAYILTHGHFWHDGVYIYFKYTIIFHCIKDFETVHGKVTLRGKCELQQILNDKSDVQMLIIKIYTWNINACSFHEYINRITGRSKTI